MILFCDLDGVLCDFNQQFKDYSLSGLTFEEFIKVNPKSTAWKIIHKAGIDFWQNMPWTKDGKELWSFINQWAAERNYRIEILTAGVIHETCVDGKMDWCAKELGNDVIVNVVHAREKQEYGTQDCILIDDSERNMTQWLARGKRGILHKNAAETIEFLKNL